MFVVLEEVPANLWKSLCSWNSFLYNSEGFVIPKRNLESFAKPCEAGKKPWRALESFVKLRKDFEKLAKLWKQIRPSLFHPYILFCKKVHLVVLFFQLYKNAYSGKFRKAPEGLAKLKMKLVNSRRLCEARIGAWRT